MYRTHHCNELTTNNLGDNVKLSGWVKGIRDKGFIVWVDLRDHYGITQLVFDKSKTSEMLLAKTKELGREDVIQVEGTVIERESKNPSIKTGEIELLVLSLKVLNQSKTPPFTIEEDTDGGAELRMAYRYLDLRRSPLQKRLQLRHQVALEVRKYMSNNGFIEIETPYLIKTTPEGARDFLVPSRIHKGQFYALPQSPQTFKQLLIVGGFDKYFQIVKCFRDEDLRADRQPEFTQIDCEMAFVEREDIIQYFEGLIHHLLFTFKKVKKQPIPRMTYQEAISNYGSDKPDLRFDMSIIDFTNLSKGKGFKLFDDSEIVVGIKLDQVILSRKQIDELIAFAKTQPINASNIIWIKYLNDGTIKSSVDKFFNKENLQQWLDKAHAKTGDMMLIMAGDNPKTLLKLGNLRLEMANRLALRDPKKFCPLWVTDFPLLEWDEDAQRYNAMHHPFTTPIEKDIPLLDSEPEQVRANAYDLILNGNEIGGGSIRIHDHNLQNIIFKHLGMDKEEVEHKFGFLINALKYGAPPHGGIAFGFDRIVAILNETESIRDVIAFPKNNNGKDLMINSPSDVDKTQLSELSLRINPLPNQT